MRLRAVTCGALASLLVATGGAAVAVAQDPAPTTTEPTIASDVTLAGVPVGGLTATQAAAALAAGRDQLKRDVVLLVGGRRYSLGAGQSLYVIDEQASAVAALKASTGAKVAPTVDYSYANVRAFVQKVAEREYRAPVDARMAIKPDKIQVAPHRVGRRLDVTKVSGLITAALRDPTLPRNLTPKRLAVKAKVTKGTLKKQYWTILTANRSTFKLRVFKGLKLSKTYPIAVGAAGHDTPPGTYKITNKAVNPAWHVPNSAWAGSLAGKTIPGGAANNPLKARWLGIADGVGIHGTSEDWSIGSRASHGCLRMHVKDVKDLYPRVPVGTTILIK